MLKTCNVKTLLKKNTGPSSPSKTKAKPKCWTTSPCYSSNSKLLLTMKLLFAREVVTPGQTLFQLWENAEQKHAHQPRRFAPARCNALLTAARRGTGTVGVGPIRPSEKTNESTTGNSTARRGGSKALLDLSMPKEDLLGLVCQAPKS